MKQTTIPQETATALVRLANEIARAHGYDDWNRWVLYVSYNGTLSIRHEEEVGVIIDGAEVPVEF